MCKVWNTFWIPIAILLMLCVTSVVFAQQKPTQPKDLQYIETVDLRELVDTVKDLTRNVKVLSDNQKELTKSVNNINTRMAVIETRMAVVEERTTWIRGLLYILLAAIVGAIATPIVLYILSNRGKQNTSVSKINGLDEEKKEKQVETSYDMGDENDLQTEGGIP